MTDIGPAVTVALPAPRFLITATGAAQRHELAARQACGWTPRAPARAPRRARAFTGARSRGAGCARPAGASPDTRALLSICPPRRGSPVRGATRRIGAWQPRARSPSRQTDGQAGRAARQAHRLGRRQSAGRYAPRRATRLPLCPRQSLPLPLFLCAQMPQGGGGREVARRRSGRPIGLAAPAAPAPAARLSRAHVVARARARALDRAVASAARGGARPVAPTPSFPRTPTRSPAPIRSTTPHPGSVPASRRRHILSYMHRCHIKNPPTLMQTYVRPRCTQRAASKSRWAPPSSLHSKDRTRYYFFHWEFF